MKTYDSFNIGQVVGGFNEVAGFLFLDGSDDKDEGKKESKQSDELHVSSSVDRLMLSSRFSPLYILSRRRISFNHDSSSV